MAGAIVVPLYPAAADVFAILGGALQLTMPAGFEVVRGQVNRVPEAKGADFSVMWPISTPRLGTNVDTYLDSAFVASIAGTTMTVTEVIVGSGGIGSAGIGDIVIGGRGKKINVGDAVFGVGVAPGTAVAAYLTGTGGTGTYQLSAPQDVGSEVMASGVKYLTEPVEVVIQLDFHGPRSWDNSATWANVFRDASGVRMFDEGWFARFGNHVNGLQPLFCDDPKQVPFTNDQDQYEDRFVVYAHMQANQTLGLPQQFASAIVPSLVNASTLPAS